MVRAQGLLADLQGALELGAGSGQIALLLQEPAEAMTSGANVLDAASP
jgi:hypothetical protein